MTVPQQDSTLNAIRIKIRRLTASPSESNLSTNIIDLAINTFYNSDFPYAIKTDQMRSVYTFYTQPYIDRYPLDVNYNQGVRAPVYVEGIQGSFYKDRQQFYSLWPRFPTKFQIGNQTPSFSFTLPAPFLSREVVIGGTDSNGTPISIRDSPNGSGNLHYMTTNNVVSSPITSTNPGIPGMYNTNIGNPGLINPTIIGSVNYVTGNFNFTLPAGVTLAPGTSLTVWISQYQTGRPYSLLFWNNEFTIRPIPKLIHKVEVETYLSPVQFMADGDNPIINQWWQYIAYGAAREIIRERQDMEGLANLEEGFKRQEALVLERQAVEEIFQPNSTLFNSTIGYSIGPWGNNGSW